MEEEFVPKKKVTDDNEFEKKIEEDIKEEFEKELRIKEQESKELQSKPDVNLENNEKPKRSIGRVISRIFFILVLLFLIFEVAIGLLDMYKLNENKEPLWYFSSTTAETAEKKEIRYHLGLYVIVKTDDGSGTRVVLKPFFLK